MSARAHYFGNPETPGCRVLFRCPGCDDNHMVIVNSPDGWGFNGDLERPTFTPSVLVRYGNREHGPLGVNAVCHSFVVDGRIQFLGDSTHALAGQTVDLPAWEEQA